MERVYCGGEGSKGWGYLRGRGCTCFNEVLSEQIHVDIQSVETLRDVGFLRIITCCDVH